MLAIKNLPQSLKGRVRHWGQEREDIACQFRDHFPHASQGTKGRKGWLCSTKDLEKRENHSWPLPRPQNYQQLEWCTVMLLGLTALLSRHPMPYIKLVTKASTLPYYRKNLKTIQVMLKSLCISYFVLRRSVKPAGSRLADWSDEIQEERCSNRDGCSMTNSRV